MQSDTYSSETLFGKPLTVDVCLVISDSESDLQNSSFACLLAVVMSTSLVTFGFTFGVFTFCFFRLGFSGDGVASSSQVECTSASASSSTSD